jgi:hypothetical protein
LRIYIQYITWYRCEGYIIGSDLLLLLLLLLVVVVVAVVVVRTFYAENVKGRGCFGDLGIDVRIKGKAIPVTRSEGP